MENWPKLRRELKPYRIGLAPVMLTARSQRAAARGLPAGSAQNSGVQLAPGASSPAFRSGLVSVLARRAAGPHLIFARGGGRGRSASIRVVPSGYRVAEGRACTPGRRRVAVLSPYFPYPLAHGGAVRIYNLLREMAKQFDVELFAFTDASVELAPVLEWCARVVLVEKPRYREPRVEHAAAARSPRVPLARDAAGAIEEERRAFGFEMLQVEYTQLAEYGGDILVEHDVTFDLFTQIARRERTLSAGVERLPLAPLRNSRPAAVSARGRDVRKRRGDGGRAERRSFRTVWTWSASAPRRRPRASGCCLSAVSATSPTSRPIASSPKKSGRCCGTSFPTFRSPWSAGADYLTYWRAFTDSPEPAPDPRIRLLDFVSDVRPLYVESNLVLVPTTVSAGTNVKVLEAMAMERAVVSTSSGCAGLGLLHGHSVWVRRFGGGLRRRRRYADQRCRTPRADGARRLRGRRCATSTGRRSAKSSANCCSSVNCERLVGRRKRLPHPAIASFEEAPLGGSARTLQRALVEIGRARRIAEFLVQASLGGRQQMIFRQGRVMLDWGERFEPRGGT